MENITQLKEENEQLKQALNICLNQSLVKKLVEAMNRIDNGEYITEEEFFKDSPEMSA